MYIYGLPLCSRAGGLFPVYIYIYIYIIFFIYFHIFSYISPIFSYMFPICPEFNSHIFVQPTWVHMETHRLIWPIWDLCPKSSTGNAGHQVGQTQNTPSRSSSAQFYNNMEKLLVWQLKAETLAKVCLAALCVFYFF